MTRKSKRKEPEWDDGRTIASMNVEGMPWYRPQKAAAGEKAPEGMPSRRGEPLTREESRYYTWGAMKAALAVVGVMCAGLILFVLFCQFVWFR